MSARRPRRRSAGNRQPASAGSFVENPSFVCLRGEYSVGASFGDVSDPSKPAWVVMREVSGWQVSGDQCGTPKPYVIDTVCWFHILPRNASHGRLFAPYVPRDLSRRAGHGDSHESGHYCDHRLPRCCGADNAAVVAPQTPSDIPGLLARVASLRAAKKSGGACLRRSH